MVLPVWPAWEEIFLYVARELKWVWQPWFSCWGEVGTKAMELLSPSQGSCWAPSYTACKKKVQDLDQLDSNWPFLLVTQTLHRILKPFTATKPSAWNCFRSEWVQSSYGPPQRFKLSNHATLSFTHPGSFLLPGSSLWCQKKKKKCKLKDCCHHSLQFLSSRFYYPWAGE